MGERLKEVFGEAAELPIEARATFLDAACGADESLRRQVNELLRAHDRAGDFLSHPAALVVAATLDADEPADDLAPGPVVGSYRLVERLGRGGSASVWRARQQQPVERDVARKVLAAGEHGGRAADRFVAECQALARMQHPAIAKVLDAGTTRDGALWLAMELIDGEPITRHCEANALPLRQRLELFAEVCLAVQHAHTKGIVHRDLKPSNVLATMRDGRPQPVVIDFGIASALPGEGGAGQPPGGDDTFGTPEYMSPEQAALGRQAIDARTDVYSLGVVLYELTCGVRPHARRSGGGTPELLRSIREHQPEPPSARAATPLPREVDWITARAMAKDPAQRYATAQALADDVWRLLRDEVVLAGPGTARHRLVKFVRRHRLGVAAVAAVLLALATGTGMALAGWLASEEQAAMAAREARNAGLAAANERREAENARREADNARREASKANRALALLDEIWSGIDPARLGRQDYPVRELLADFERTLPERAGGEPAVELRLRCTLARLQMFLGSFTSAEAHATRAVTLANEIDQPAELASALLLRARSRFERGELAAAEIDAIDAQRLAERHPEIAGAHLAPALELRADCRMRDDDREGASQLAERALALRLAAGDPTETARSHIQTANLAISGGRMAPAMGHLRSALECLAPLGEDHPDALVALQHLAHLYQRQGDLAAAEATFRDILTRRRRVYGEDHPQSAWAESDLAWLVHNRGDDAAAEPLLRHALPALRQRLGERHLYVSETMQRLGAVLITLGKLDEAGTLLTEALHRYRSLPAHPVEGLAGCMGNVARLQWLLGDRKLARATQTEGLALAQNSLPPEHFVISVKMTNLAAMAAEDGELEQAVELLRQALQRSTAGGRAGEAAVQRERLVGLLRKLGRDEEAAAVQK